MWPWKRRPPAPPKPDYNLIARLEVELGIVDPPVVQRGTFTRAEFDLIGADFEMEEWLMICREQSRLRREGRAG